MPKCRIQLNKTELAVKYRPGILSVWTYCS